MNQTDLAFTPALQQAELIRQKAISPLELTDLYLDRISHLDPQLGSYFTVMADQARQDATAKTEQLSRLDPQEIPPFFGVPISIKDLNAVAGVVCTYGSPILKEKVTPYDDGVVTKIRQAGFVLLGKTATCEFGSLPYTEATGFLPTRNPWNLDYTPGGSSGGAAAALAAGLCAIAQGSDGGGSVRGPAFCCGLVGIKPSRGRVSYAPAGDYQNGIATNGPLARTVADAAALLDVMSGYITGDPYWLPDPETSFVSATTQDLKPLRIAFSTDVSPLGAATEPCANAVLDVVKQLESMGHPIEAGCPDFTALIDPFIQIWKAGMGMMGMPKEYLQPMNRWLVETCGTAGDYLRAVNQMQVISRQIVSFFDQYDVLVLPTYMHPQIRVGEWAELAPEETLQKIIQWICPCPPFNATGQPAIALPTGFHNGLPVGVQLIGRPAAEATLITLAAQLEKHYQFYSHRPEFAI